MGQNIHSQHLLLVTIALMSFYALQTEEPVCYSFCPIIIFPTGLPLKAFKTD